MSKRSSGRGAEALGDISRNVVMPLGLLSPAKLLQWAHDDGHRYVEVSFMLCNDRKSALKALGQALELPQWFGANLDALYDSLTDLVEPLAGKGLVVVLRDFENLESLSDEDKEALLDVFRDAAEAFADDNVALRVLVS